MLLRAAHRTRPTRIHNIYGINDSVKANFTTWKVADGPIPLDGIPKAFDFSHRLPWMTAEEIKQYLTPLVNGGWSVCERTQVLELSVAIYVPRFSNVLKLLESTSALADAENVSVPVNSIIRQVC